MRNDRRLPVTEDTRIEVVRLWSWGARDLKSILGRL